MRCIVFCSVEVRPTPGLLARLAGADRVVAADGGAGWALGCGLTPDLVIGDLDSIDSATLARLRSLDVPMEVLPTDKDATDGEIAVQRALAWGATELTIVGALGGPRVDHELANVLMLGRPEFEGIDVTLLDNANEVCLLRSGERRRWVATPGEIVSLLPIGGAVDGVRTSGLRWPLADARLEAGSTRGVSNEAIETEVEVRIGAGRLLVTRTRGPGQTDWAS